MKRFELVWLITLLFLALNALSVRAQTGRLTEEIVHSTGVEKNLLGDSPERAVLVYLPPSYQARTQRRYPVLYLLHGYDVNHKFWAGGKGKWAINEALDCLITRGEVQEMIIVMPDGSNQFGGSFYTNSVTTGNWEDFITEELVAWIDKKYRTLPQAASRGIAGYSMGGYGAIKLGMKHPEIYGALYSLSACCLDWAADFSGANPAWDAVFAFKSMNDFKGSDPLARTFTAISAAWSPNPQTGPFFAAFPFEWQTDDAGTRWAANMPVIMVDQYRSNLARLRAIGFDAGKQDEFAHIPIVNRAFSRGLTRNGIQHTFEEFEGTHSSRTQERVEKRMLPFISRALFSEPQSSDWQD